MASILSQTVALTEIFNKPLVKIDSWLIPQANADPRDIRMRQATVASWLDLLGEKSSQSQRLDKQLTTADKLRKSDQEVYLYVDRDANNGRGAMLGFLRMGWKSLYFHLENGDIIQATPQCVLDFYVVEEHQRKGIGKKLFDYMMQDKGVQAYQLAIDKPSPFLIGFMAKHYGLKNLHVHSNNYAVEPQFFKSCSVIARGSKEANVSRPVGRYAAQQPTSEMDSIIHGGHVYKKKVGQSSDHSSSSSLFGSRGPSPASSRAPTPVNVDSVPTSHDPRAPASLGSAPSANSSRAPTPTEQNVASSTASSPRAGTPADLKFYHTPLW